jgi:hypothetical protein
MMPRRTKQGQPEILRQKIVELFLNFENELQSGSLRTKVLALVTAYHSIRDLGASLIPIRVTSSGRDRVLHYLKKYAYTIIDGDELMVVSGIQDWPRRLRELRVQFGWNILSGMTAKEMSEEEDGLRIKNVDISTMKPDQYLLASLEEDREAAHRWYLANTIRKGSGNSSKKILEFLRKNVGKPVTGEELRYVSNNKSEWARRVRELRTDFGWPVVSKNTGRPDLPIGTYVLEQDRKSADNDRKITDPVRRTVLVRDKFSCTECGWSRDHWTSSDPRHLELHHIRPHIEKGSNEADNLKTLCTVCHDRVHAKKK